MAKTFKDFEEIVKSVTEENEFIKLKAGSKFAAKVVKARLDKGLTQAELAVRAGLSQSAIARIENQGTLPRIDTVYKIACALDTDINFVSNIKQEDHDYKENMIQIEKKLDDLASKVEKLLHQNSQHRTPRVFSGRQHSVPSAYVYAEIPQHEVLDYDEDLESHFQEEIIAYGN